MSASIRRALGSMGREVRGRLWRGGRGVSEVGEGCGLKGGRVPGACMAGWQ